MSCLSGTNATSAVGKDLVDTVRVGLTVLYFTNMKMKTYFTQLHRVLDLLNLSDSALDHLLDLGLSLLDPSL